MVMRRGAGLLRRRFVALARPGVAAQALLQESDSADLGAIGTLGPIEDR
jgi:hypothetical protein